MPLHNVARGSHGTSIAGWIPRLERCTGERKGQVVGRGSAVELHLAEHAAVLPLVPRLEVAEVPVNSSWCSAPSGPLQQVLPLGRSLTSTLPTDSRPGPCRYRCLGAVDDPPTRSASAGSSTPSAGLARSSVKVIVVPSPMVESMSIRGSGGRGTASGCSPACTETRLPFRVT